MADDKPKIRPIFIVKPGTMSREDIQRAEDQGGICIVECSEPEAARFLDPPMLSADYDAQMTAAWRLMRYVIDNTDSSIKSFNGYDLQRLLLRFLLDGSPIKSVQRVASKGAKQ